MVPLVIRLPFVQQFMCEIALHIFTFAFAVVGYVVTEQSDV